jgi:hypothetical protein
MLLLGNAISLVGCVLMVAIGFLKKKEHILGAQCVQFALMGAGNLVLGALAGVISNGVSIVRNLVLTRMENKVWLKVAFIFVQTGLTVMFSRWTLIEWLPVIAVVVYTWFLDIKNPVAFKLMIIGLQVLWTVYDFYYRNYVAFTFDLFTILSTTIGIFMIRRDTKQ